MFLLEMTTFRRSELKTNFDVRIRHDSNHKVAHAHFKIKGYEKLGWLPISLDDSPEILVKK